MFDLSRCRLYGILDLGYVAAARAPDVARALIAGGADIIQLRGKNVDIAALADVARSVGAIARKAGTPLVINDHPQLARDVGAHGVHVGQDDVTIAKARELAGAGMFVGKSTHTIEQARGAAEEGADYIGFGPLFATPTKPAYAPIGLDQIRAVHELVTVPVFCIGGIKLHNLPQVLGAGARRVVIVSEMLQAADVAQYARTVRDLLARGGEI